PRSRTARTATAQPVSNPDAHAWRIQRDGNGMTMTPCTVANPRGRSVRVRDGSMVRAVPGTGSLAREQTTPLVFSPVKRRFLIVSATTLPFPAGQQRRSPRAKGTSCHRAGRGGNGGAMVRAPQDEANYLRYARGHANLMLEPAHNSSTAPGLHFPDRQKKPSQPACRGDIRKTTC